jgi:hypothetical protein
LLAVDRIALERGAVYVDSGRGAGPPVEVVTEDGRFMELGTQFEVRIESDAPTRTTCLRVREGRVAVAAGGSRAVASAGEELLVGGEDGLRRRAIERTGPSWEWVLGVAPTPRIQGVSVRAFLDWWARETGLEVELADAATAARVDGVVLNGSIAHLSVWQAPGVVLPSAGLGFRLDGGRLEVFVAKGR